MNVYVCIYIVSSILVPDTECKTTFFLNISFIYIKMNNLKQIHYNSSSSENVHLLSFYIKLLQHICLELFWTFFTFKCCTYFSLDSDKMTKESNIMDRGIIF